MRLVPAMRGCRGMGSNAPTYPREVDMFLAMILFGAALAAMGVAPLPAVLLCLAVGCGMASLKPHD